MISPNDDWTANLAEVSKIDELAGLTVAIDAADYLSRLLNDPQWKEPLLSALGGLPFAMKRLVEDDIQKWRGYNITPYFIFNGLDFGKKDNPFRASDEATRVTGEAWELYNQSEAERAVATFGEAPKIAPIKSDEIYRNFQALLHEANVHFLVAPYSAWGQLAYLEKHAKSTVHAIAGASELLLFDIEQVIISWDWEHGDFTWLRRKNCMADLGNLPADQFVDACLLAGSDLLPTLPLLESAPRRNKAKAKGAAEMMLSLGRSGVSVCQHYQDDPKLRSMNYTDRFMRTRLAIQHHVVLTTEGKVEVNNIDTASGDIHEFISQRLPDEIYFYLSKGTISPRILNVRASGGIVELAPLDGGDSVEYRVLVTDQLTPLRTATLALLSQSLHRFYQHKDITLQVWFDRANTKTLSMRDAPDVRQSLSTWNVRDDAIQDVKKDKEVFTAIGFAIRSLKDGDFASKTISKKDPTKLLSTTDEILYNAVWRFLQVREYVDSNHNLTPWGQALQTSLAALKHPQEHEEAVFLAIELVRLNLLNSKNMFPSYGGQPLRGTETDKRNNLLVSRVACLGKLRHKSIGFTGPLSRHLLGYHSIISAVRSSLRDLAEVSLTTLLLNGDAERDRDDFTKLALKLPFLLPNDCALGIAVKSYLDELHMQPEPTSAEAKASTKARAAQQWFPESIDLPGDLRIAFELWDAVYAGVKVAGSVLKDRHIWDETDAWLTTRR